MKLPVSIQRGASRDIQVSRCLIFDSNLDKKVIFNGIHVKNNTDTIVESGTVQVIEDGNFVGESILVNLRRDEDQYLTYAMENAVSVEIAIRQYTQPMEERTVKVVRKLRPMKDQRVKGLDDETATLTSSYKCARETTYSFVSATQRNMPMLLVTHNKTKGMSLVSATVVGSGETVPVEAIRDESSHQAQAIAYRMAVRLPALLDGPVAIRVLEELTETKEEVVDSNSSEWNLENIERSMKTFTSCGLLTASDANAMQAVIEKTRQNIFLTNLQGSLGNYPSSPKEVSALLSKGWITESEAALVREIIAQKIAVEAIHESLDTVAKVKNSAQEHNHSLGGRHPRETFTDEIHQRPGRRGGQVHGQRRKEAELQAAKKAADADISKAYHALQASLVARLAM